MPFSSSKRTTWSLSQRIPRVICAINLSENNITDDILSATSSKPIQSKAVYDALKNLPYVDYSKAQALTDEQKSQAKTNIGIDHDKVVYYSSLQDDIIEELTKYEIIDQISDSSNEIFVENDNVI